MYNSNNLLKKKRELKAQYKQFIEDSYNFMQTDCAYSDFSEYRATLILNEINKLKFVIKDQSH
jgi:hypothetical protein